MPRPSDLELKRNRLARLKATLDECGYRLVDALDVEDPHTRILRANALAHRLGLGRLITRGGDDKARLVKDLALLPELSTIFAFQASDAPPLRVGKIAKTDEQLYSELVSEFTSALAELNEMESEVGEDLSTPGSVSARIDSAPKVGRPSRGPLENLDRGLAENYGTARLALAKAIINEQSPRHMGRPARSVGEVQADYKKRKDELEMAISKIEDTLRGVEIHDRATKIRRDTLAQLKRLVKEVGGPDQIEAKAQVALLEQQIKFLKADRKKFIERGEPDMRAGEFGSPRWHLLKAKEDQAVAREIYDEVTLPREIKRFKETEEAARKAKAKK